MIWTKMKQHPGSRLGLCGTIVKFSLRFAQLIAALVVIGMYTTDLNHHTKVIGFNKTKWTFALVTGCISAISCTLFATLAMAMVKHPGNTKVFVWEWLVAMLWVIVTGIFGRAYLPRGEAHNNRMTTAAGFDAANLILWMASALHGTVIFFRSHREAAQGSVLET